MLVLSRRMGESVQIGDNVFLKLVDVRGSVVRIGLEAPEDVRIIRTELIGRLPKAPRHQPDPRRN